MWLFPVIRFTIRIGLRLILKNLVLKEISALKEAIRAHSLVVSDLHLESKGSRFESGYQLCAEVSSLH